MSSFAPKNKRQRQKDLCHTKADQRRERKRRKLHNFIIFVVRLHNDAHTSLWISGGQLNWPANKRQRWMLYRWCYGVLFNTQFYYESIFWKIYEYLLIFIGPLPAPNCLRCCSFFVLKCEIFRSAAVTYILNFYWARDRRYARASTRHRRWLEKREKNAKLIMQVSVDVCARSTNIARISVNNSMLSMDHEFETSENVSAHTEISSLSIDWKYHEACEQV